MTKEQIDLQNEIEKQNRKKNKEIIKERNWSVHRKYSKNFLKDSSGNIIVHDFLYKNDITKEIEAYEKRMKEKKKQEEFENKIREIFPEIEENIPIYSEKRENQYYDYIRNEYFEDLEKQIVLTKETIAFSKWLWEEILKGNTFGFKNLFWQKCEDSIGYYRLFSKDYPEESNYASWYPPYRQVIYYGDKLIYGYAKNLEDFKQKIEESLNRIEFEKKEKDFKEKYKGIFEKREYSWYVVHEGMLFNKKHFRDILKETPEKVIKEATEYYEKAVAESEELLKEIKSKLDPAYKQEWVSIQHIYSNELPIFLGILLKLKLKYKNKVVWSGEVRVGKGWEDTTPDYDSIKKYNLNYRNKLKDFLKIEERYKN